MYVYIDVCERVCFWMIGFGSEYSAPDSCA